MEKFFTFVLALEYLCMTVFMLFEVQGYFGYILGIITLIMTGFTFKVWFDWPIVPHKPKQDLVKRKPLYTQRRKYY